MAKKKPRYPKKFRMKLERMEVERDIRKAAHDAGISNGEIPRAFRTLHQEIVHPGSIHTLHTKLEPNGDGLRLNSVWRIRERKLRAYVDVPPPWQ